jgi:acetyl-CoA acyltransferase
MQEAYIVAMSRSAITKAKKGGFRFMRTDDLAIEIIKNLMHQVPELTPADINDVIVGCANPEGEQGLQIGRQIALRALGIDTAGMTVNRYCASGLETIAIASAKIRAGMGDCFIAGGIESMSMIPMEGYKLAPNFSVAESHPDYLVGMGLTAEAVSKKYNISREDQDIFALSSHQKAAAAFDKSYFAQEITPVKVKEIYFESGLRKEKIQEISLDEGIRRDTNLESLQKLKPVFAMDGTVTAGNSSQTSDGAAFVIVMSEKKINKLKLKPKGRIVSCSVAGVEPLYMGMGPCAAVPKALDQASVSLSHISLIELNEAFAAQSLAVIRMLNFDPELVNIHGGAIALGHPLGCSGARLTMTALHELRNRKESFGLVTACVGGGQGIAAVVEAMW